MELGRPLATITPTLDGDVLAVLARSDVTFTTGQLHRILTRNSEEGIRKVLARLVRQGIVYSDKVGNAFTYRLNRDHLAAEYVIGLANLQTKLLKRIEDRLESWTQPPVYAAVFGSAARGSMAADSDLDLLLIQPDDADDALWETQVSDLTAEVTRWTGNDARPLEFTASDLAARGRDEPVLSAVLDHGLTVAGTRSWLSKQLRKR
ncbi:MAG TPA: nucleotidyltransferase domain-containing protein [Pseudonocardiaceae bacterium]|nr:nucleotidyltransferase domain-containing protein [Pseudonocardiaceae bacterium]